MKGSVVIIGGGTGGHIFPALSLCEELAKRGLSVTLLTDQRGLHYEAVHANTHNLKYRVLFSQRLPLYKFLGSFFINSFKCLFWFLKERPVLVISFGGYMALSPMMAAQCLFIPTMIHEQNAVLGRAHRFNARFAKLLATSFPVVRYAPVRVPTVLSGNPVRQAIANLHEIPYQIPGETEPFCILIVGGSQGAKIFSDVIPKGLAELGEHYRKRLNIIQQCRPEAVEETTAFYENVGIRANVQSFFNEIEEQYRQAHLIIARSGASTVTELTIAGRPAILIPYSYAVDNHQQENAEQLEKNGGAWVILEKDFTTDKLKKLLEGILKNPGILAEKAERMRRFSKPQATSTLAKLVVDFLEAEKKQVDN
ncbi:MAG: undecaprenyldiphospho-muramoylpentapeptide beta-N-acetylglucosaminyltransferase [Alphaproteobacteria bacterium]